MSWTDERVEMLQQMWSEGQSAAQIAKTLGGVTRNAVIGKVHRLGLSNRTIPVERTTAEHTTEKHTTEKHAATEHAAEERASAEHTTPEYAAPDHTTPESASVEAPAPNLAAEPDPAPEAAPGDADTAVETAGIAAEAAVEVTPPAPHRPAQRDPLRREPAPMTEERLEVLANLAEIEKTARRVTLMDLTERVCKWPIGDPTDPAFRFCGLPAQQGKPYCEAHVAVAFQPMSSRRDRDRQRVRN